MRLLRAFLLPAALFAAHVQASCDSTNSGPVPTTLVISPSPANLAALGQTQQLTGQVLDQNGDPIAGATVAWTSNGTGVVTVSAGGLITAVANGSTTITGTAGSLSGNVPVTVAQVAAQIVKLAGDAQTGTAGAALATNIRVRINDALGNAISGLAVSFAVTNGGGNLSATSVPTDASGEASTSWTVGTVAGAAQQVTATVPSVATLAGALFAATATAGSASQVVKVSGDNQTGVENQALSTQIIAAAADQFGNRIPNVTLEFVASNGGSAAPASGTTNAQGELATTWTLGAGAGPQSLTATIDGTVISSAFGATAQVPGSAANIAVFVGDNQISLRNFATNIRPAVRVTDGANLPVSGVSVTFTPSGSGSVTGGTVVTNANGVAQVGSWTPGTTAGSYTLSAQATGGGITGNPVMISATAQDPQYNIEIRNVGPAFSPEVQTAFDLAKAHWEAVIYGELSNIAFSATSVCGGLATLTETVDDLLILARFDSIDGPSQVLGSAGACSIRTSNGLTIVGQMRFDTADVAGLIANGTINAVVRHEMGHVIGFSTAIWNTQPGITNQRVCAQNLSTPGGPLNDTHFMCSQGGATNDAVAIFDSIGGTSYTGGAKVPLENCVTGVPPSCGAGNINSHWREATFFNEMMTGFLNSGVANPFSILTIASFGDIGYLVNYAMAEAYARVFSAPAPRGGVVIDLSNDVIIGPIDIVDDRTGRVVRTIMPR